MQKKMDKLLILILKHQLFMESKYSTFILFSAETQLQEKHSFIADHIPGPDWL